jgi:hypothetical protein
MTVDVVVVGRPIVVVTNRVGAPGSRPGFGNEPGADVNAVRAGGSGPRGFVSVLLLPPTPGVPLPASIEDGFLGAAAGDVGAVVPDGKPGFDTGPKPVRDVVVLAAAPIDALVIDGDVGSAT